MRTLLSSILILVATPALAAENAAPGLLESVLKLIAGLVAVLGIMLLLYALSKKGLPFLPRPGGGAGRRIKIVEMRSLGPKKALYLVEVGGQQLLLGAGAERIELITRLEAREPADFDRTLQDQIGRPS